MSMHEIEDLVEFSIRVLHNRHRDGADRVRDAIAVLYRYQGGYDCSCTQFRVLDELLIQRYTYRFAYTDHPDHAGLGEFLDGCTEFTALAPEDIEDPEDWLEDGYVDPPHLYCDAGTELWRRMVESGRLTGRDAVAPRPLPLSEVVLDVVTAAEEQGDVELIALWHALGGDELLEEAATEDPERVRVVRAVHEIAVRTGAVSHELPGGLRPEPYGDLESWWSGEEGYEDIPIPL